MKKEVKIALVAIVAIVILFFGLQFLKGLTLFGSGNRYYAVFDDVSGMSASSPVYANGYRVGVVEAIDYDYSCPDRIVAVLGLDTKLSIPRGTRAEIASDFLGNVKVELKFGSEAGTIAVGDTISGGMQKGALGKAADMVPQIETMLPKLDSILASINTLLADPAVAASLHNAEQITAQLTTSTRELNTLMAQINGRMPRLLNTADSVMTHANDVTRQLSEVDVAATMSSVNATLANVRQLTDALNSKEGSLGLLMRDPELYRNLTRTMGDADSLLIDVKAHPRRYINVSVFGRKEK